MRIRRRRPLTEGRPVVVIGSGTHFISGISYYTHRLALTLGGRREVGVILMRKLIPRFLYPGRERVGSAIADLQYPASMPVVDGVDWYGGLGLLRALVLIARLRPGIVVLQWWTGAVLHSYIVLSLWARLFGADIVVDFHEVQDTGEAMMVGAAQYVRLTSRLLMAMASGAVVHSASDLEPIHSRYGTGDRPTAVITHGPFDHYAISSPIREAPADAINLLFFGTIRPYKGLEHLVEAFNSLDESASRRFWLTVVGETWERWTGPLELINASPHRSRITLVNRYVTDEEIGRYLAGADGIVLPYLRSSASGPLHVAMSAGLPIIITAVGGLPEAAAGYEGAIWIPPADPPAIRAAFEDLSERVGQRFEDPSSWDATLVRFEDLFAEVAARQHQRAATGD